MSVLSCNRKDCENVMCDRYSDAHGYICDECFAELLLVFPDVTIASFMDSPKSGEKKLDYTSVLEQEFRSRWDEDEESTS